MWEGQKGCKLAGDNGLAASGMTTSLQASCPVGGQVLHEPFFTAFQTPVTHRGVLFLEFDLGLLNSDSTPKARGVAKGHGGHRG